MKRIVHESGFVLKNEESLAVQDKHEPQVVTKIGVNWKINPDRKRREQILGEVSVRIKSGEALSPSLEGQLAWLTSVNPNIGKRLRKALRSAKGRGL